ncbi:MAG: phosphate ABC transporter substrate-binding protein [bacterium]|nr:phosphate ABC transporter substrate-binding protein [bacterium]MDD3805791.1 phosphate ABC transporter substrate-binding protein [bacterium]MDD4557607.1 phosphate ABC transporter substrate-binding protein [bacterium]
MIKRNLSLIMALIIASVAIAVGCGRQSTFIQIKGSDTMVNLAQVWAEAYMQMHPEASIAVTGGGSGTGIVALLNGTTDIALSSRDITDKEIAQGKAKGIEPIENVVALDGIAVIVNPANKIGKLNVDQLSAIFTGRMVNWNEVGGADRRIVALSRDRSSGTHVFFLEYILRKGNAGGPEEYGKNVLMLPSSQAIAEEVMQSPDAIGYIGLGYLSDKVKDIALAADKSTVYIKPSAETIRSRAYLLSRSLLMYTNGAPQGTAKAFIDFVFSPKGQKIVEEQGFVSVK